MLRVNSLGKSNSGFLKPKADLPFPIENDSKEFTVQMKLPLISN